MKSKELCRGCRDDYYNHQSKGGCWSYDQAKIVTLVRVGIWEEPPYSPARAEKYLNCYRPDGYAMLKLSDPRVREDA